MSANTADNVTNGQSDLTAAGTYSGGSPGTTNDVVFTNVTYSPATFTLSGNSALSIGTLNDLSSTALTISNGTAATISTLTLNGGTNSTAGAAAGDLLYVGSNGSLTVQNGTGTLNLALASTGNLDVAGTATIGSVVSGSNGLTKTGAGTLTLSGTNTYTGGTTITAGTVSFSSTIASGASSNLGTGSITLNGGTLKYTGADNAFFNTPANYARTITIGASGGTFDTTNTGTVLNGNLVLDGSGTFNKTGSRALELNTTTSTFTGAVNVNAGALRLWTASSLGTTANTVTVASGAHLDLLSFGNYSIAQNVVLNGVGDGHGALQIGQTPSGNVMGIGGSMTISSDSSIGGTTTITSFNTLQLNGALLGSATLTKVDSTKFFINSANNTFTGNVNVYNGALQTGSKNALGSGTNTITVAGAGHFDVGGTNSTAGPITQNLVLSGDGNGLGAIQLFNDPYDFNSNGTGIQFTGTVVLNGNTTIGGNTTFHNGTVGDGFNLTGAVSGAYSLTKTGNTQLTLSNAGNNFSGGLKINSGIVRVTQAGALPTGAAITLGNQGVFSTDYTPTQALLGQINSGTGGVLAISGNTVGGATLDLSSSGANMPNVSIGAVLTFNNSTATWGLGLTPNGTTYRLGGGGGTLIFNTALTGANNLVVGGALGGTVTLGNAANNYTGATTINSGTLNVASTGSIPSASAITFNGTGTFNATSAATGTALAAGALAFGAGDATVQSTYGTSGNTSVTFASLGARTAGATGNFVVTNGANGTTNKIVLTGQATGTIDQGTFFGGSNYAYYDSTGYVRGINWGVDSGSSTAAGGTSLASVAFAQTTGAVTAQTTQTFTGLNIVNSANSAQAFTLASGQTVTTNGILRSGNGGTSSTTTISGGTAIRAGNNADLVLRANLSNDLLTISTPITANGSNALVKSGAGTVTLSAVEGYTGATYIDGGTLKMGIASVLPTGTTVNFNGGAIGATLDLNSFSQQVAGLAVATGATGNVMTITSSGAATLTVTGNSDFVGVIKNAVALTVSNGNTVTLSNNNTYTGATTVSGGATLKGGMAGAFSPSSVVTLGSTGTVGTLDLNGGNQIIAGLATAGTAGSQIVTNSSTTDNAALTFYTGTTSFGGVIQDGASKTVGVNVSGGTITLSGANTYTGTTIVTGGTLLEGANNSIASGPVTISGGTFDMNAKTDTVGVLTLGGTAGGGTFIGTGGGTLTATSVTVSGTGNSITSGTVAGNATQAAGSALAVTGTLTGTDSLTAGATSLTGTGTISGVVTFNGGGNTVSSTGTLTTGGLIVNGTNNTLSSGTVVGAATLGSGAAFANNGALTGDISVGNGTLTGTGSISGNATVNGGVVNFGSGGSIGGTLGVTGGNWNGAGSVTGATTSSSGTLTVGSGANLTATGGLNVTGGSIASTDATGVISGSVNYTSASSSTFGGVISGSGKTLTLNNSSATLTLSGANTYTGATTITAGKFVVNGSLASGSPVSIGATATLGGSGTIGGTVALAGTLSPGNSPGLLSTGAQTWSNGGNYNWQVVDATGVAGTGFDSIAITSGGLNLTGLTTGGFNINLWSLSGTGPDVNGDANNFDNSINHSWTLVSNTGNLTSVAGTVFNVNVSAINGTNGFSNALGGGLFSVVGTSNSLDLVFTAATIPEPSTYAAVLGALALVGVVYRRRRS